MDELFELRLIREMGIVEMLFVRKTAEDIVELRNIAGNTTIRHTERNSEPFTMIFPRTPWWFGGE